MNLQEFLKIPSWDDENWSSNIRLFFENDNLDNCKKICNFIDENGTGNEDYEYLFNISFNMNCIRIFTFLWNNKRGYDNHDIYISEYKLSKKSQVGQFYFDELYKEKRIQGVFLDHCYRKNMYNISHILTYLIEKDYEEYLFLCKEAYSILISKLNEKNAKECLKLILLFDDNVSKHIFSSVNNNYYFYKFPKIDVERKPTSFFSRWNAEENDTSLNRARKAKTFKFINLRNYDIILNKNETGYRNSGVYIYKDNELHKLSNKPDDYGSLPEWVDIRKEDCGHSYFTDGLIDNNTLIPFKTDEWKITNFSTDKIKLHREKDNATAIVKIPISMEKNNLKILFEKNKVIYFESVTPCELRLTYLSRP